MDKYFSTLNDYIFSLLSNSEILITNIHGENSQFIRFNNSKVRQTGLIDDMSFSMELINNNRTTSISVTLTGNENKDKVILLSNLAALRNNIASLPEDPFMPVPKYQDFDLDKMTERLFKEDFSANFGIPPGPEPLIGNVEEFDRMFGDIGNTVFGDDISIYDVSTGRSYASKLSKPKNYKEADKLDETTLNQIKKVYNQVGGLDPERDNFTRTSEFAENFHFNIIGW